MRDVHLSLASATEHKLTGGEYLGRKPVGLQDFEAVGLGALPNTATPAEMYLAKCAFNGCSTMTSRVT
jgi:hypothetical protein